MKVFTSKVISLFTYLFVVLLLIYTYIELSYIWTPIGKGGSQLFKIEIPLILLLSLFLYFPRIQNKIIKYVVPVLPIYIIYSLFDIFYSFFGRSPRPSDFQNYITVFDFSPVLATGLILYALILPLSIFILFRFAYRSQLKKIKYTDLAVRALSFITLLIAMQSGGITEYSAKAFKDIEWSQQRTIRKNGRISSFIHSGIKEKESILTLSMHKEKEIDVYRNIFPGDLSNKKNVHIIVLESFIDPRELKDVAFNNSPLAPGLKKYFHKSLNNFSHVLSPTYGGGTSQGEFELLTGVKALAKISSIEFNVLDGGSSSSLINRLKEFNYSSIATVASNSDYYNSKQAYKSLGFPSVTYMEEIDYKVRKGDSRIFDGDVFDYSFNKIKSHIKNNNTPIITYVLGMYGHFPYERNQVIRPDVLIAQHEDERVQRISNQFYYRTKAISKYIDNLIKIDPESIIYVTSDHLPPLLGNNIKYTMDKKVNISLLLNEGQQQDVTGMHYYEIPWLIWDMLSNEKNYRDMDNEKMERLYYQVLYESIRNDN